KTFFFERDLVCYAAHRGLSEIPGVEHRLYQRWEEVLPEARKQLAGADAAIVTSCCPDELAASDLTLSSSARISVYYELDPPAGPGTIARGEADFLCKAARAQRF